MDTLQTLNLTNSKFSNAITSANYQEIVELVNALEQQGILSFLTIDQSLYTARQGYFDDWDAQPLNELTVVPEPATFLLFGAGMLFLRRRKN